MPLSQALEKANAMALPSGREAKAKPFVQIEQVTKKFADFTAVNAVSLEIYQNELFCLLGGSGSGKSTLLRILAGFESLDAGRILIDGVDMAGIPPWQRPVNMMFQSYALFPHLTVAANVAFGLRREGVTSHEVKQRVANMLDMVQLGHLSKRKPHSLSGGQQQRVALARALIKRPKLLLLDEPLGALDKKLREETQFELINLQDELGVTFIVVTHDQEEAMTLATRIGVMDQGSIVQIAEPHQVYEYPNSRFVAEFIGNVNLFEGRVMDSELGTTIIESAQIDGVFRVDQGIQCAPHQDVCVAIRPEKIRISREKPANTVNSADGIITDYAYMGSQSIYKVALQSGKEVRVTLPNFARDMGNRLTWDEPVFLSWDADSCLVLTS